MADLKFTDAQPSDGERAAVDAYLGDTRAVVQEHERLVRGGTARRHRLRHLLLPVLHELQRESGWISPGGLNYASEALGVPPAEAYGVASFYELFKVDEAPAHDGPVYHVCVDGPCRAGAETKIAEIEAAGGHVHRSPCLGQCERPTAVFIQGRQGPDVVEADAEPTALPQHGDEGLRLLHRIGVVDPNSLDSYRAHGGYTALDAAIAMGADAVLEALGDSGLSGRGGAAFPTGFKWRAVRDAEGDSKHIVANCDESEPGTFKDRTVMENDPFSLIEAMTIAAVTTGATNGWIYIRGEYPLATERVRNAIAQARAAGLLGADVAGSASAFDIEVRLGAGAYICGEETALFNSIEGFRGEPRNKPPFPTTHGLFSQPTAINNPETLLNVLPIVLDGAEAYRSVGTEGSPGTRLFCVSGHVANPGLYELPFGTTLGELLQRAGGVEGDLQCVLMGGAAGSFVDGSSLDLALTLEDTRAAGTTLGSGVVMVLNESVDMTDMCTRISEFFRNESCGQCVPCRVGAVRQHEIMVELGARNGQGIDPARVELHDDMSRAMADASICGLGHTAASAVASALKLGLIGEPA
ncbi:MAG: NADH-ubiquinone oxidoreductase-F iron-sulfur binding region domain-containing protein [Actinomycetota bacterium]